MKRILLGMMAALVVWGMGQAQASEMVLGAGDVVKISVFGNQDLTTETRISDNGTLTMPLVGAVGVDGLTSAQAEQKIAAALASGGFVKNPQVSLIVSVISSQQVSVLGQVNRAGRYPIDGRRTVLDLLALGGGVSVDGGDVVTLIRKRNGKVSKDSVDIIELVRSADLKGDYEVQGGDIIYVERAPRCYIYGEVQRPGALRLERQMTVLQALSAGGGLTPRGTERGIRIKRRDASGKIQVLDAKQDDLVQVDDVIYVKESLF